MNQSDQNTRTEQLIFDGNSYLQILLNQIQKAQKEILVSTYIFNNDEFGSQIFEALQKKAKLGVQIKFLIDGYGSWPWIKDQLQSFSCENFHIRVYHLLPWPFSNLKHSPMFPFFSFFRLLYAWNKRNHQKLFIFDQSCAILGSRNIWQQAITWRETSILVQGSAATELHTIFNNVWDRSHNRLLKRLYGPNLYKVSKDFQYVFTTHLFLLRRNAQKNMIQKIINAQKKIQITTPYFFPTKKALQGIMNKAQSGVDVCLLLPKKTDVRISKWISLTHYERLLNAGVKIYEYNAAVLHAKSTMIDGWAVIGSSNFNRRSLLRDLEIDYLIHQSKTIEVLQNQFEKDLKNSVKIGAPPETNFLRKLFTRIIIRLVPSWF